MCAEWKRALRAEGKTEDVKSAPRRSKDGAWFVDLFTVVGLVLFGLPDKSKVRILRRKVWSILYEWWDPEFRERAEALSSLLADPDYRDAFATAFPAVDLGASLRKGPEGL